MMPGMNTLTVKLPQALEQALQQASAREHLSKSVLVRRALEHYLHQQAQQGGFVSALDQADDLVGCFRGGPDDLASNPAHLAGFGRR